MARRDDVGALLEGDGIEDTTLDGDGDNTGDAGDRYRGALQFGTTAAEASRGQCLDERLAEEEPDVSQEPRGDSEWRAGAVNASSLSWSRAGMDRTPGLIQTCLGMVTTTVACRPKRPRCT